MTRTCFIPLPLEEAVFCRRDQNNKTSKQTERGLMDISATDVIVAAKRTAARVSIGDVDISQL